MSSYSPEKQIEKMVNASSKYGIIVQPFAILIGSGIAFSGFTPLIGEGKTPNFMKFSKLTNLY